MTCHIKKVLEMKKTYRFISFVLSMVMMFSLVISASAAGAVQNVPQKITWNDLPEAYKQVIEPDAVIYKNSDGTFDIYQKNALSGSMQRSLERYEPNGGTYSNFSKESYGGSKVVLLVYQTFMPHDTVGKYLVQNKTTVLNSAIQWVAAYGITTALSMLAQHYGLHISDNALNLAVSTAIVYFTSYNYNQMLDASGGGQYGVQIDYITTIGAGNSRVYSRWSGEPYVLSNPNGGTANWAAGQYYAEP